MKNSIPLWVEFLGMGNEEWGIGKNYLFGQCPMPKVGGRLSLSTHSWVEFPANFLS
ncbi:MAG: hypothetical protein V7K41_10300 [Nostoc sp.]|uniref:hypothetical protein n=1 Tax=Nostoc sp. TaxID=1180 RepID=UPI002FFD10C5